MSDTSSIALLLQRIGTYLKKAKAEGAKENQELKIAKDAFEAILESLYGKSKCMDRPMINNDVH